ncbi:MAG: hypothetical protein LC740_05470, partial [Actinobacteria bacterium]|nr:hypothetical protein [Actinomycetota bacterium]
LKAAVDEAVDQYARWASPEEPEKFLEEAFAGIEDLEKGSSVHEEPRPSGHEPSPLPSHHHGPSPPPLPPGHKHPR